MEPVAYPVVMAGVAVDFDIEASPAQFVAQTGFKLQACKVCFKYGTRTTIGAKDCVIGQKELFEGFDIAFIARSKQIFGGRAHGD